MAFSLALIITDPPGPGLDPDAMQYMGAAESVAAHGSYRIPNATWKSADSTEALAHFPPGYSTVLALPIRLGMQPTQAARLVQATAAFVTVTTLVLLVSAASSPLAGILLAVALFGMTAMHEVHVSVLSEPLYLACTVLVLAAMVLAPTRPLRAGLPAAVGVMTRYAGASLVAAAGLWALLQAGTLVQRLRRAVVAVLPAVLLQGAWVVRTRLAAGPGEIRRFAVYGKLGPTFRQGAATLSAWLIPDVDSATAPVAHRGPLALAAFVALATLAAMGVTWLRCETRPANAGVDEQARAERALTLLRACALLLACYAGVVLASRLLADPEIPLDERIMSPALLLLMTMLATTIAAWWRRTRLDIARIAVAGALLGWWFAAASATQAEAHYALDWGSDFAGEQWRRSDLLDWARHEGAHTTLYSNWPAAVYFHLHRTAHELPARRDAATITAFADTVRARGGRVLLFDAPSPLRVPNDSLRRLGGLRVVETRRDGVVLAPR